MRDGLCDRALRAIEFLADNGSPYAAKETSVFATQLGLTPCFTLVASLESNGIVEAFEKTIKRDYVRVNPLPAAAKALTPIVGWIGDYDEIHPHSGLQMRSPREFQTRPTLSRSVHSNGGDSTRGAGHCRDRSLTPKQLRGDGGSPALS